MGSYVNDLNGMVRLVMLERLVIACDMWWEDVGLSCEESKVGSH